VDWKKYIGTFVVAPWKLMAAWKLKWMFLQDIVPYSKQLAFKGLDDHLKYECPFVFQMNIQSFEWKLFDGKSRELFYWLSQ